MMEGNFAAYDLVDQMPDEIPVVKYPRTPGYRPDGAGEQAQRLVREDRHQGRVRAASSRARRWR